MKHPGHGSFTLRLLATLALAALLAMTGCGGPQTDAAQDDGSLEKILNAKQLVLGLDASFPPMGFTDEAGEIVGFDIDMAQEVCERLGVTLVKRPIDWDTKEEDLNTGAIDCIWNGLSVTPGRAESMNLSEPYMKNQQIFVVLGDSDAKGLRDLSGARVGVQSGSTAQEALEESSLYGSVEITALGDNLELMELLRAGSLDAVLLDSVVAYYYISASEESYFVLPDSLSEEKFAVGFRKGDQALRDRVQELISDMKADGTLGEISRKWFGSDITTVK